MNIKTVILLIATLTCMVACNEKIDDDPYYQNSSNVAVKGFYLKSDSKVMANLDSVFFSIDLENALIYNADSLPRGTEVTSLIPIITCGDNVSSATIVMTGGRLRSGEVNYLENPNDSIDFSGKVFLNLVAQDGVTSRSYELKVNVHNVDPDLLQWDQMAVASLPSRLGVPIRQKTVQLPNSVLSLIQERNNSYTLASTSSPNSGEWKKQEVTFRFDPEISTLAASSDLLYMLDTDGNLYSSSDGIGWNACDCQWVSMIGAYSDAVLGIESDGGILRFARYPQKEGFIPAEVPSEFPVSGTSNLITISSKWAPEPIGLFVGGVDRNSNPVTSTWGYDGSVWAEISQNPLPIAVEDAVMVPYFMFRKTSTLWINTEYSVLMLIGGRLADGNTNGDIYISYDNGVNWSKGSENVQMPSYMPQMTGIDYAVVDTPMEGNFSPQTWSNRPSGNVPAGYRVQYNIDGYNISWNCPYIYLFGGYAPDGTLYDTIWKGVINRLTFMPLI